MAEQAQAEDQDEVVVIDDEAAPPANGAAPAGAAPAEPPAYQSSIDEERISPELAAAAGQLEARLGMPVFLFLQADHQSPLGSMTWPVRHQIVTASTVPAEPVAIILDSPGGQAREAYLLARFFQRHCGGYTVVVPRWAKSAATLFSLGADRIMLGSMGELGPLDAQLSDPDRESTMSALDEIQALERFHAFAMDAADSTMFMLTQRTGKKVETLLPMVLQFAADIVRPLIQSVDAIHYTQMSRVLKVAEEYAVRLLEPKYGPQSARIASALVERYPDHEFVIDAEEARTVGLEVEHLEKDLLGMIDEMYELVFGVTAFGRVEEVVDA